MQLADFILEIEDFFPPNESSNVIAALMQDPLIWNSLQQEKFFRIVIEHAGHNTRLWSPANLVLIALGEDVSSLNLSYEFMVQLDNSLRQRAMNLYEETLQDGIIPTTLAQAGLLALALRERRRLSQTWNELFQELSFNNDSNTNIQFQIWRTPFTCLYGLIPDPTEMLSSLVSSRSTEFHLSLAAHVFLCNLINLEEQEKQISKFLLGLTKVQQMVFLRVLSHQRRSELVKKIARMFLDSEEIESKGVDVAFGDMDFEGVYYKALELHRLAGLHRLINHNTEATNYLETAQKAVQYLLAGLNVQIVDAIVQQDESEKAFPSFGKINKNIPESGKLQTELIHALVNHPHVKTILDRLPEKHENPIVQIIKAGSIAEDGDRSQAIQLSREAVNRIVTQDEDTQGFFSPQFVFDLHPESVIRVLLDLDLLQEALQCAHVLLRTRPVDSEMIDLVSLILEQLGDNAQAVNYARMKTLLEPEDPEGHRHLAELWESATEWNKAFNERRRVIKLLQEPSTMDWLGYAQSALEINQPHRAMEACDAVLENDSNNRQANVLMGKALIQVGDYAEAARILNNSTLLSPREPDSWLLLAEAYKKDGKSQRVFETLRAATLSIPDSADINFAMGEAYNAIGSYSDALPFLKKAAGSKPESPEVAYKLGNVLITLGYITEANEVLEKARERWPKEPGLAFAHAEALIAGGKCEAALLALEVATQSDSSPADWFVLYATTLIGNDNCLLANKSELDSTKMVNAQQALEKALTIDPDDFYSLLLMAEVLYARECLERSLEIYRKLSNYPESDYPEWLWRVKLGIGQVALMLGDMDNAIAALQEAANAQPGKKQLQHLLSEAYLKANLYQDAFKTAQYALTLAPDDLDNLTWFSNIAIHVGEEKEAVHALQCATQLAPGLVSNWIELAALQLKIGDINNVISTLKTILDLDNISSDYLRKVAYMYLRLEDCSSALDCLNQAIKMDQDPSASLFYEVACVNISVCNPESALEALEKAIDIAPEESCLYVAKSDLLSHLNRPKAALACLEHALTLRDAQKDTQTCNFNNIDMTMGVLPLRWFRSLHTIEDIHIRIGYLLRQTENITAAYHHLEQVLKLCPKNLFIRYTAADLASAMLHHNIGEILSMPDPIEGEDEVQEEAKVALLCLRAEIALESDEEVLAGRLISSALSIAPDNPRVMAAQARLLIRWGNLETANEYYNKAKNAYKHIIEGSNSIPELPFIGYDPLVELSATRDLWMSESALEHKHWDDALELIEKYVSENPYEPRAHLRLARMLVIRAERQRLCNDLMCKKHIPGFESLSEECYEEFRNIIQTAKNLSNSSEVERWYARGKAVFNPSMEDARILMNLPFNHQDTSSLVAALHNAEDATGAIHMAERSPSDPYVLLQLALCCQEANYDKGLQAAKRAVEANPTEPLAHVALALAAQKIDQRDLALQSLETALKIWPDEPEWHAMAAKIADQTDSNLMLAHWEKAYIIDPANVEFVLSLGQAYLDQNNPVQAIEVLSKASQQDPERMNIRLMLSQAYQQADLMDEALECARRASDLDDNAIRALLQYGEIALIMGKTDKAFECAEKALSVNPKDSKAILLLSKVLVHQGKLREALDKIEQSLPLPQTSIDVLFERASLISLLDGPIAALPRIQELLQIDPENPKILGLLAHTQAQSGNYKNAEQTAHTALQLDPEQPSLNLLLGHIKHGTGQLDQAVHYLSESIRQNPNVLDAYLELGQTYQQRRENIQALSTYKQAIIVAPNDYQAYYQAGLLLRDSKDYVEAEMMLRKAAELSPEDIKIRRQLGAVIALNLVHNAQEVNSYL